MKDIREHAPVEKFNRSLGADAEPTWVRQEKRLSKAAGGRRQPASGAGDIEKGDIKTDDFLIEAKATDKGSISIKIAYLEKISREAVALGGRVPAVAITFGSVPLGVHRDWVLVPKEALFGDS